MAGVVEAGTVSGRISAVISIIEATKKVYDAAKDAEGQPEAIKEMNEMPPSLPNEDGSVMQTHSGSGENTGHTGPGTMNLHKGSGIYITT